MAAWVRHMEDDKKETVTGPMLSAKHSRFENQMCIPEEKRLLRDGWIAPFCKAYGLKERRRHGEAASADIGAVVEEQGRISDVTKKYTPRDTLNLDKSSFFIFTPPDHSLCTKALQGKKKNKFCITVCFVVNADGSEKFAPIWIGKSEKPVCFGHKSPRTFGYDYYNNKKAWMKRDIFEQ